MKRLPPFLRQVAAHASKNQLVAEGLATFFGTASVPRTHVHVCTTSAWPKLELALGPVLMRTEGEASLQALVSHTSEILFLTAYMINFTPTDLLFSFPEEGKRSGACRVCVCVVCVCVRARARARACVCTHFFVAQCRLQPKAEQLQLAIHGNRLVEGRRPTRGAVATHLHRAHGSLGPGHDEEGRVPRRPTIPYAPLRISNTAAPAEDTASVYIDEQSLDDSQSVINACRVPCAVCRVPCAVCRVPCAVCRVPCAVRRVPTSSLLCFVRQYCPPHEPSGLRADGSDQLGDRSDVVRVHGSPIGRPGHVREPSGAPWAGGDSELAKSFDYSESVRRTPTPHSSPTACQLTVVAFM